MNENQMTDIPLRADYSYIEEEYELYELTHCIAYEMATRNEEVKSIMDTLTELTLLHKKFIVGSWKYSITFTVKPWYQEVVEVLSKHDKTNYWFDTLSEIGDTDITYDLILMINAKLELTLEEDYYMVDERKSIVPEGMEEVFNGITDKSCQRFKCYT